MACLWPGQLEMVLRFVLLRTALYAKGSGRKSTGWYTPFKRPFLSLFSFFSPTGIRKLSLCYKLARNFLKRENEKDEGKLRGNESDRCQSHEHESKKRLCNLGRNTSETNGPK